MTLARKRERAWRVTRKLRSLVILARVRERVPGESLESIGKSWKESGLDGRVLHRSILKIKKE